MVTQNGRAKVSRDRREGEHMHSFLTWREPSAVGTTLFASVPFIFRPDTEDRAAVAKPVEEGRAATRGSGLGHGVQGPSLSLSETVGRQHSLVTECSRMCVFSWKQPPHAQEKVVFLPSPQWSAADRLLLFPWFSEPETLKPGRKPSSHMGLAFPSSRAHTCKTGVCHTETRDAGGTVVLIQLPRSCEVTS